MKGLYCSEAVGKTGLEAGSVTRAMWEQQPKWAGRERGPTKSQLLLLQSTTPALHWPAPCPHIPSHPTHHPGTLLQAETSCQPSAAHGPPSSSTEPARSMASPYGPSVSTWVTQMSTLCITWCGYVGPSRPVVPSFITPLPASYQGLSVPVSVPAHTTLQGQRVGQRGSQLDEQK